MQHQWLARQPRHQAAGKADVAAQPDDDIGLDAPHHRARLPKRPRQPQRQAQQRHHAFAAHAREINRLQRKTVRGDDARLHAGRCAQPVDAPAARAQLLGHGQTRKDMPTGATGHDERGFADSCRHAEPPWVRTDAEVLSLVRISNLFS